MKVATIVPTAYLNLLQDKEYHLCLAQVVQRDTAYKDFYKRVAKEGKYVILDNGAAEGETVNVSELVSLAVEMQVSELILPDYLEDEHRTLDEAYKALHHIKSRGDYQGRIMAVPQADTFLGWLAAAREMLIWPINTIGIPKFLTYKFGPYARLYAIDELRFYICASGKSVHLLGCAYDPREIGAIVKMDRSLVRGVDSSLPYLYARDGHSLLTALREGVPRSQVPVDFNDSYTPSHVIAGNIHVWERMCRGELL